jgi:hypothetical protein
MVARMILMPVAATMVMDALVVTVAVSIVGVEVMSFPVSGHGTDIHW